MLFKCVCGKKLRVADEAAEKKVRCPNCKAVLKLASRLPTPLVPSESVPVLPKKKSQSRDPQIDQPADQDRELSQQPSAREKPTMASTVLKAVLMLVGVLMIVAIAIGAIVVLMPGTPADVVSQTQNTEPPTVDVRKFGVPGRGRDPAPPPTRVTSKNNRPQDQLKPTVAKDSSGIKNQPLKSSGTMTRSQLRQEAEARLNFARKEAAEKAKEERRRIKVVPQATTKSQVQDRSKQEKQAVGKQVARPPLLKMEEATVPLGGTIRNVVAAGGGRYLIIQLDEKKELVVFDAKTAKLAGTIPLDESEVEYAAGLDDLIVFYPKAKRFDRWDIESRERKLSRDSTIAGPIYSLAMGAGSHGPLLIELSENINNSDAAEIRFYDPKSLRNLNLEFEPHPHFNIYARANFQMRPALNGWVVGCWNTNARPNGIHAMVVVGNRVEAQHAQESSEFVVPNVDGSKLYTSQGLISPAQLSNYENDDAAEELPLVLPSFSGAYDFSIRRPARSKRQIVSFHLAGKPQTLFRVSDVRIPNLGKKVQPDLSFDRQIWFMPQNRLLVSSVHGAEKLYLRTVDFEKFLDSGDIDYLLVSSRPRPTAPIGETYWYQIKAKSSLGKVSYQLDAGPQGMTLSESGELKWDVPKGESGAEEFIIVSIGDASGRQKYHSFKLTTD